MAKQRTSFALSAESLVKLAELVEAKHPHVQSKAHMLEVLIHDAHKDMKESTLTVITNVFRDGAIEIEQEVSRTRTKP